MISVRYQHAMNDTCFYYLFCSWAERNKIRIIFSQNVIFSLFANGVNYFRYFIFISKEKKQGNVCIGTEADSDSEVQLVTKQRETNVKPNEDWQGGDENYGSLKAHSKWLNGQGGRIRSHVAVVKQAVLGQLNQIIHLSRRNQDSRH